MKNQAVDWTKVQLWIQDEPKRMKKFLEKLASKHKGRYADELLAVLQSNTARSFGLEFDPDIYPSFSEQCSMDYLFTEILSKNNWLPSDGPDEKAFSKFFQTEDILKDINQRLSILAKLPFKPGVEACVYIMQRKIASFLDFDVESFLDDPLRWGPGTTYSVRHRHYTVGDKLLEFPIKITPEAWKIHSNLVSNHYGYTARLASIDHVDGPYCLLSDSYSFCDEARLVCVPKTSKISRVITVEPTANVQCTLSYGEAIRKRLKLYFGVDLHDQSYNQALARNGVDLGLATVDLSSASDSISTSLINLLFPTHWAELLLCMRSSYCTLNKKSFYLEKFAGMGNGLTFPIETLIFHTASLAVCEYLGVDSILVNTYGDDIIIPIECVPLLEELLRNLGFRLNLKKTHTGPNFRESCGSHWLLGNDVKPVYIREAGTSFLNAVRNHNNLFAWLYRHRFYKEISLLRELRDKCPIDCYHIVDWAFSGSLKSGNPIFDESADAFFVWTKPEGCPGSVDIIKKRSIYIRFQPYKAYIISLYDLEKADDKHPETVHLEPRQKREFRYTTKGKLIYKYCDLEM